MTECLIAFGGNLSNPKVTFQLALTSLCAEGLKLKGKSGLWRSPAWPPGSDQPDYLNAVVKGRYNGKALDLLAKLNAIEETHGRVRGAPNGDLTCKTKRLTLPHPRMLQRAFVLLPAAELEPKLVRHTRHLQEKDIRETRYAGAW